jgi:hypothetical protein
VLSGKIKGRTKCRGAAPRLGAGFPVGLKSPVLAHPFPADKCVCVITKKHLEKRFGILSVEKRLVTKDQLVEAVDV